MRRPLIYYSISVSIGCISSMMLYENALIGAVITASFFAILFFTLDEKFFIINILFFAIGISSFTIYFNIKVPGTIEVRMTENKGYYYVSSYKGRKILLNGKVSRIKEGERVKIYGTFKNDKDFSRGVIGNYKVDKYDVCKKDYVYYLYEIKRNIYTQYKEILGDERSALVMALCYGDTGYLTKNQKNEFLKMGVFHAVSVSGFHMAIIYKVLEIVIGLKFAILVSFIYILFTGMQASTVRAFIMIIIFKFSKMFFKNYDNLSSLALSAIILLIIKPYYIIDVGFMLSFLATLGIILYYKKILRTLYRLPQKLNESLSITLSSQIFSVPYTAFNVQNFSGGFILGNIFLLPMYSVVVILGNLALLLCSIPVMFKLLSSGLNFMLTAIEGANYLILKSCPPISYLTYLDGFALILIYLSFILYKHGYRKFKYLPSFILILILFQSYSFVPQVYYINFSEGEGVVVKYKTNKVMVCSYSQSSVKEVINIKEKMNVDKIFTNPEQNFKINIGKGFQLGVMCYGEGSIFNTIISDENKKFVFINNNMKKEALSVFRSYDAVKLPQKSLENNSQSNKAYISEDNIYLYVIIFNRIFRVY